MELWSILGPIITAAIASISALAVAWITGHYTFKNNQEERDRVNEQEKLKQQQKLDKAAAEDLDKIIYPAIYSLEISKLIKQPNNYHAQWFNYLIYDDTKDLERELIQMLNSLKATTKPNIVIELIQQTLLEKYELVAFFKRYNLGDYRAVKLDVQKLNTDIEFINCTLGKHYEQFNVKENI